MTDLEFAVAFTRKDAISRIKSLSGQLMSHLYGLSTDYHGMIQRHVKVQWAVEVANWLTDIGRIRIKPNAAILPKVVYLDLLVDEEHDEDGKFAKFYSEWYDRWVNLPIASRVELSNWIMQYWNV